MDKSRLKKITKKLLAFAREAEDLETLKKLLLNPDIINLPEISNDYSNVNILILNTPCEGFGDLIFALKLSKILEYEYKANVKIATTTPDILIKMSGRDDNVYKLAVNINDPEFDKKISQCKRYTSDFKIYNKNAEIVSTDKFDLFFDAPIVQNYDPDLSVVQSVIPKANRFNTFFFSEYNDYIEKGFDFNMGIGGNRSGMLFLPKSLIKIEEKKYIRENLNIKGEFCLIYIAPIKGWKECMFNFLKMVFTKYQQENIFTIICPHFVIQDVKKYHEGFFSWFSQIIIYDNEENSIQPIIYKKERDAEKSLIIRGNILPVNNSIILSLMKYSIPDILLTGDQSITDMLTVSTEKNIFYQIADWKENFGEELSKLMPQKYLEKSSTSCGTMEALDYHGNYHEFVKQWNFTEKSDRKIKTILTITNILKNGRREKNELYSLIKEYTDIVNNSKNIKAALKRFL
jgi:hypothetical protein